MSLSDERQNEFRYGAGDIMSRAGMCFVVWRNNYSFWSDNDPKVIQRKMRVSGFYSLTLILYRWS